jgi:hypothetical protein
MLDMYKVKVRNIEAALAISELGGKDMSFGAYAKIVQAILRLDDRADGVPLYGVWLLLPAKRIRNFTNAQWDEASDWAEETGDAWDDNWDKDTIDPDTTLMPVS